MKRLITTIVALIIVAPLAGSAMAYVAVVTTSVAVASAADEAQLGRAVDAALADVLAHAIAFAPTRMTLEGVRVIGDRIYLILLMADEEGEKSLESFSTLSPRKPELPDQIAPGSTY
jgi:hypothetical protein